MNRFARAVVAIPILVVGVVFFAIGTVMLMAAHYIDPNMTAFDGWIDRVIDGSKEEPKVPSDGPLRRALVSHA